MGRRKISLGRPGKEAREEKDECPYCVAPDTQSPPPAVSASDEGVQELHTRVSHGPCHLRKELDVPH